MDRKSFIKLLATTPIAMNLNQLKKVTDTFAPTPKMPVVFIGHGHPMNALFTNAFTQTLAGIGTQLPKPSAIMMISAHWLTRGTYVSVNPVPPTIYDFGGFDDKLFEIKYPAKGHPTLAKEVTKLLPTIKEDAQMGLDHGTWTVLKHMYPQANIPVFQLSLDITQPLSRHYELATQLKKLREKGVLIMGSGNVVHNLGRLNWGDINAKTEDWALEFDMYVKKHLQNTDANALMDYRRFKAGQMAVPSEDHYLPMIYSLGLTEAAEPVTWLFEGFQYANISMRCYKIG